MMAMADQSNVEINGIYYNLFSDTNEAEVTINPDKYSGNVAIPSSITYGGQTYSVTSIGEEAFKDCNNLTGIDFPSSLKIINDLAFHGCRNLTSAIIPEGVTIIGLAAFMYCNLTDPNIPSSATFVGNNVFSETPWYYNQTNGVIYLDNWLLICRETGAIVVKEGTRGIASKAFMEREGVTSVVIPSSIISICDAAFYLCTNLTSVKILGGTPSIEYCAFAFCYNLSEVALPEGVTKIGIGAFENCYALKSVTIPSSIESIEKEAFYRCYGLTNVTILDGVKSIGDKAFYECTSLKSIVFPQSITSLGEHAFSGCNEMTDISFLGGNVKSIGNYAFYNTSNIDPVVHITDLAAWCAIEFGDYYANPLVYDGHLILNGNEVKDLVIPDGVTKIGNYAFYCCRFSSATIPSSVTTIGIKAFCQCIYMDNIVLSEGLTTIEEGAFASCNFENLIIPSTVTSIGICAFDRAGLLSKKITSLIKVPFEIETNVFWENIYNLGTLYVPFGTKGKYETTAGWKNFVNIVEMEETSIDTIARNGEVTMKDNYSLNGQRVFSSAKGLNIIKMSDGTIRKVIVK